MHDYPHRLQRICIPMEVSEEATGGAGGDRWFVSVGQSWAIFKNLLSICYHSYNYCVLMKEGMMIILWWRRVSSVSDRWRKVHTNANKLKAVMEYPFKPLHDVTFDLPVVPNLFMKILRHDRLIRVPWQHPCFANCRLQLAGRLFASRVSDG